MATKKVNLDIETVEQDVQKNKNVGFKKLSINALDEIIKNIEAEVELIPHSSITFKSKRFLSTKDTLQFVDNVVNTCVVSGIYYPALFDFAFKSNFIEIATNIQLPSNINKSNSFIYGSNVFEVLEQNEDVNSLIIRLRHACKEQIELITKKSKADELLELVIDIVSNFDSQFNGIDIQSLADKLSSIGKIDEKKVVDIARGKIVDFPISDTKE